MRIIGQLPPIFPVAANGFRSIFLFTSCQIHSIPFCTSKALGHRRRIKTEEKAKVVAFVWREESIQVLAALAVLPKEDLKNRMNSYFSFASIPLFKIKNLKMLYSYPNPDMEKRTQCERSN